MSKIVHEKICNGRIISIEKSKIWISIYKNCESREKTCSAGCGGCSKTDHERKELFITENAQRYKESQTVSVKQYRVGEAFTAFLLFGVPVLCALLLLLIWSLCSPQTVESLNAILSCAAAFLTGFIPVMFVERYIHKNYPAVLLSPPPASLEMVVNG